MLAAGDSTQLEIIFSTKSYRNRIAKSPTIQTNEGPPNKRVRIESTIVQRPDSTYPLIMSPYKLDLSQNSEKVIDKLEFEIQNVSDEKLDISLVSVASDYFEVDLPKSVGAGKTEKAKLKLLKSALEESFEKSFTIEVSDSAKSRFTVPVKRTISSVTAQQHGSK
jgi:hypothetical protein